jgi:tRNA A-37 threonylcarbamoyl transferase component Bud32
MELSFASLGSMDPRASTVALYPLVGQTFKHYRLEAGLGQGGMGVVYRALDTRLQRPVALKLLARGLTADPERSKRFILEARAAARVTHPAIAQIYDVDEHDASIFIAMELVEGRTIRELIQGREIDLLGAIDVAMQIAQGLARAHEMGIVHRDIKPANVILAPDGHVKILDFGLAKLMDSSPSVTETSQIGVDLSTLSQTQIGSVKGTPAYMSPEQIKGLPVDARSDLFSLGVMLFEMATGEVPFHRSTMMETMHAVAFDDTPSMLARKPNLPGDLQRIVMQCLRKRPEDRYQDARSLASDLRSLRRDTESGMARPSSFRERMGDLLERFGQLKPGQYVWIGVFGVGIGGATYLLYSGLELGGLIFLGFAGLMTYRNLRHQPQRLREWFVRRMGKLPEIRLITFADNTFTVIVDRPSGQLFARINRQLNTCNQKLFFGHPMSVIIRADATREEIRQLLASPGVQHVRDDVAAEVTHAGAHAAAEGALPPHLPKG